MECRVRFDNRYMFASDLTSERALVTKI
uniref:Uncharacterized protein n=1 Tax=Nelumbo nucifera TaxID=4432 RepID=A0A822ZI73_NELNU|nr:TPA_asm: hypothetical protein HUJ06_002470 [Nelumbo nucifera]